HWRAMERAHRGSEARIQPCGPCTSRRVHMNTVVYRPIVCNARFARSYGWQAGTRRVPSWAPLESIRRSARSGQRFGWTTVELCVESHAEVTVTTEPNSQGHIRDRHPLLEERERCAESKDGPIAAEAHSDHLSKIAA